MLPVGFGSLLRHCLLLHVTVLRPPHRPLRPPLLPPRELQPVAAHAVRRRRRAVPQHGRGQPRHRGRERVGRGRHREEAAGRGLIPDPYQPAWVLRIYIYIYVVGFGRGWMDISLSWVR